jgi:hypothetical protein
MTTPLSLAPAATPSRPPGFRPQLTCAAGRSPCGQPVIEIRHRRRPGPAWEARGIRVPVSEVEGLVASLRAAAALLARLPPDRAGPATARNCSP